MPMAGTKRIRRLVTVAAAAAFGCSLAASTASADPVARVAASAEAPLAQLAEVAPVGVPGGGTIARYRQRVDGLPVLGAEAVVADPPGAPPTLVVDHTVPALDVDARFSVLRSAAIAKALDATAASELRGRTTASRAIDPASGAAVWRVLIASGKPLADYEVVVDGTDGRVVRITDLLRRLTGSAMLYLPNPVTQQGGYSGLSDRKDKDSTLLSGMRQAVALERLTSTQGCLVGQYVSVGLGKERKRVCVPGSDFRSITRRSDKFEALMAYYWIDRTRAYLDGLGLSKALSAKPQKVRANAIAEDNSFFSPKQRSITYGTGGVDDGEDGDVIVHEYGHSVQDQQVHFFGARLEGASMGEGFSDYLAAVMSSFVTGGTSPFDACMFEWDAVSYTSRDCARRTDKGINLKTAKRKCQEDPHCLGEVWSGALWRLRPQLGLDIGGRSIVDRLVLESHFMLAPRSDFRDGARAVVVADQMLYGGAHVPAITAEFVARGLCPAGGC
jgi:Fungalysin metallopeptidase (M36)